MTNLAPNGTTWNPAVYQFEDSDAIDGGAPDLATKAGLENVPHLQLASQLAFLKALDGLIKDQLLQVSQASLANPGYVVLEPGGLHIQWANTPEAGINQVVTFPKAFPNACFVVVVQDGGVGNAESNPDWVTHYTSLLESKITKTQFTTYFRQPERPVPGGSMFLWLAIGH